MHEEDGREVGEENTIIYYNAQKIVITGRFSYKENLSVIFHTDYLINCFQIHKILIKLTLSNRI